MPIRPFWPPITAAIALAALAAFLAPAGAQVDKQALREKVCAEANERYKELFGKAVSEETMPIVLMYDYHFCPGDIAVKPGTTVRWINVDKRTSHSVWFRDDGKEESVRLFPEEHVDIAADLSVGEHTYYCGPHWESEGMKGMLKVEP